MRDYENNNFRFEISDFEIQTNKALAHHQAGNNNFFEILDFEIQTNKALRIINGNGQEISHSSLNIYSEKDLKIINKKTEEPQLILRIKREVEYHSCLSVDYLDNELCLVQFERSFHFIFLHDFSIISLPGRDFVKYGKYFLVYTDYAYTDCESLCIINSENRATKNLDWFIDFFENYDGYMGLDFQIFEDIFEYRGKRQKFFFDLSRNYHPFVGKNNFNYLPTKDILDFGCFIDYHTIKSRLKSDGTFETVRTNIGELLYKYKYCFDKSIEEELLSKICSFIIKYLPYSDILVPIPPSKTNRPYQPLILLSRKISERLHIPVNTDYLVKAESIPIKNIDDSSVRKKILETSFSVKDKRYCGKTVLLLDDLFRSGDTVYAASKVLKTQGGVNSINLLAITKTRTKR